MKRLALACVVAFMPATTMALAQSKDDVELRVSLVALERVFVEIRSAEINANTQALDTIARARVEAVVNERVNLARQAITLRAAAHSARELASAEMALATARLALANALPANEACARELLLETVEDLLLRRFTADATDATLAIGLPTADERIAARKALTLARAALDSQLLAPLGAANAAISTDPGAFRAHMLLGLVHLIDADLSLDAQRSTAQRSVASEFLERAARTELPLSRALKDVLALGRARALSDNASLAQLRAQLLAQAATSADATLALVARVELWKDGQRALPFPQAPALDAPLALLAACAEARARALNNESSTAIAAALERVLRAAQARDASDSKQTSELTSLAYSISQRLNDQIRAAALRDDAPLLLVALASLQCDATSTRVTIAPELVVRAADATRNALIAPWLTIPCAEELHARGGSDAQLAIDMLEWLVANTPATATTRATLTIVIDERLREAVIDANSEIRLDETLAMALAKFPSDNSRDAWLLARVDLALFPLHTLQNLDRAAETLLGVSTAVPSKNFRDLRSIEIEFARLPAIVRDRDEDMQLTMVLLRRAELLDIGVRPPAAQLPSSASAIVRLDALRAAASLRGARPSEAKTYAVRAMKSAHIDEAAAARAAATWVEASLVLGDTLEPPSEVLTFAAQHTAMRSALLGPIAKASEIAETAVLRGDSSIGAPDAARNSARENAARILSMALLALATPEQAPREVLQAQVLAQLVLGEASDAEDKSPARARRLVEENPDDRRSLWLLAESLRIAPTDAAHAEAFALLRELAPLSATDRDSYWWRAQIAQLEMLGLDPARALDIAARVNRLAALDANFGDARLTERFTRVRAAALKNGGSEPDNRKAPLNER